MERTTGIFMYDYTDMISNRISGTDEEFKKPEILHVIDWMSLVLIGTITGQVQASAIMFNQSLAKCQCNSPEQITFVKLGVLIALRGGTLNDSLWHIVIKELFTV